LIAGQGEVHAGASLAAPREVARAGATPVVGDCPCSPSLSEPDRPGGHPDAEIEIVAFDSTLTAATPRDSEVELAAPARRFVCLTSGKQDRITAHGYLYASGHDEHVTGPDEREG
jgi:hypothetical protein